MITKNCSGCGACNNICPVHCITMQFDEKGYYVPNINTDDCSHCGECERVCPILNSYMPQKTMLAAYLFINGSDYYRNVSSSGGFFMALADRFLRDGGVVFGARLVENTRVEHDFAETTDAMFPLMTSKYVQSDTKNAYAKTREFLESGRQVLFSGTPCQIGGLNSYLGKEYQNLTTIELFCHGIPSPYSWQSYVKDYHGDKVTRYVQFRYKGQGWWQFGLRMQFLHDDYYYPSKGMKDPFMRSFLKDINLNDECYQCKFKSDKKNADFTIGDAWNINRIRCNNVTTRSSLF